MLLAPSEVAKRAFDSCLVIYCRHGYLSEWIDIECASNALDLPIPVNSTAWTIRAKVLCIETLRTILNEAGALSTKACEKSIASDILLTVRFVNALGRQSSYARHS